jgi:hypothetical protein
MLRPPVSWPVYLGIKHPLGLTTRFFFTVKQLRVCWCGALCLTRGRVCLLQLLLGLASTVILGSESCGTQTILYCLRFEASLFVAFYDSQCYGGRIRSRLHTAYFLSLHNDYLIRHGSHRKHLLQQSYYSMCIRYHGDMFTESLPINDRLLWLHCPAFRRWEGTQSGDLISLIPPNKESRLKRCESILRAIVVMFRRWHTNTCFRPWICIT